MSQNMVIPYENELFFKFVLRHPILRLIYHRDSSIKNLADIDEDNLALLNSNLIRILNSHTLGVPCIHPKGFPFIDAYVYNGCVYPFCIPRDIIIRETKISTSKKSLFITFVIAFIGGLFIRQYIERRV